jgi:hypothetical protein
MTVKKRLEGRGPPWYTGGGKSGASPRSGVERAARKRRDRKEAWRVGHSSPGSRPSHSSRSAWPPARQPQPRVAPRRNRNQR